MTPAKYQKQPPSHRPRGAYLTVLEVAAELRISTMTIYRRINDGALPAKRIGRGLRISERDLDAYLDRVDTSEWVDDE